MQPTVRLAATLGEGHDHGIENLIRLGLAFFYTYQVVTNSFGLTSQAIDGLSGSGHKFFDNHILATYLTGLPL